MGRSDEYQFDYLDDAEHFADQINGALFRGRQVVKPGELEEADRQTVFLGEEAGARKNIRTVVDKARIWRGRLIHILVIENQSYVDYHMVLRNMLSESLSYQKQWKQKKRTHERKKDLKPVRMNFFPEWRNMKNLCLSLRWWFIAVRNIPGMALEACMTCWK